MVNRLEHLFSDGPVPGPGPGFPGAPNEYVQYTFPDPRPTEPPSASSSEGCGGCCLVLVLLFVLIAAALSFKVVYKIVTW